MGTSVRVIAMLVAASAAALGCSQDRIYLADDHAFQLDSKTDPEKDLRDVLVNGYHPQPEDA
ncbi:hypothetical protein QUV00_23130, partial [Xanthomonas citri pv. citri]